MNTKLLLLVTFLLLIALPTASSSGTKNSEKEIQMTASTSTVQYLANNDFGWLINWTVSPDNSYTHPDDDGKMHHIHFSRILGLKKRRRLALFISKIILIVSHVCCLLYGFMHLLH